MRAKDAEEKGQKKGGKYPLLTAAGNGGNGRSRRQFGLPRRVTADGFNIGFYLLCLLVTAIGLLLERVQDNFIEAHVHLHFA